MMGMTDVQYMQMETPADKPMMPGHAMCQQMYDESVLKADDPYMGIPMETFMLPHRLFESTPEKGEQGNMLESSSNETPTMESGDDNSPDSGAQGSIPESPRSRTQPQDSIMPLMSPSVRCLASPTPTTPKRQCYVPETPSPDRMHCSWLQQPTLPYTQPAPLGGVPCYYGAQAHDQVIPEFLQMMPCMAHHEGQHFGDLAQ